MDYLLLQILLFLILAAVVGFFIGWITRGSGFESRLLASENKWRAKHHLLLGEKQQLQSELDAAEQEKSEPLLTHQDNDIALSLPFKSAQDQSQLADTEPVQDHPLNRLRSEIIQIEKEQIARQISGHNEIFEESALSLASNVGLDQLDGEIDDLKAIKGIGPKIESTLNNLGIYHLDQIADFTEENIIWVNEHLQFSGRIEREKWVAQAQNLIRKN